jgi:hypothetical protein
VRYKLVSDPTTGLWKIIDTDDVLAGTACAYVRSVGEGEVMCAALNRADLAAYRTGRSAPKREEVGT